MALIERYKGYSIFDAVSVTTSAMGEATKAYRVRRRDKTQLGDKPFTSLDQARSAIDDDIMRHRLRFVLNTRTDSEKDVVEKDTDRRIGHIKFIGPGQPHSAFDVNGNLISDQCESMDKAKQTVIDFDARFFD